MNLQRQRPWITPLVIGAFLLLSVTGVLMFFHLDSGLNKTVHEWLSWVLVAGVALHVALNLPSFKRYLSQKTARWVMGSFALLLALSFIPLGGDGGEPAFAGPIHAMAQAPLPVLAQVVGLSPDDVVARLQQAGYAVAGEQQTLQDVVGPTLRAQITAFAQIQPAATTH
jgi:hypothetical protein